MKDKLGDSFHMQIVSSTSKIEGTLEIYKYLILTLKYCECI